MTRHDDTTEIQRALVGGLADEFTERSLYWKAKAAGIDRYLTDPAAIAGWQHFSEAGEFDMLTFHKAHPEHAAPLVVGQTASIHAYNLERWIEAIREGWKAREFRKALLTALEQPHKEGMETVGTRLEELQGEDGEASGSEIRDALAEIAALSEGKKPESLIQWEIPFIDQQFGAIGKHEFVVIGARPSQGKSALIGQCAHSMTKAGKPVSFFSLEMPIREILHRMTAAQVGFSKAHLGPLHPDRNRKYLNTFKALSENELLNFHFGKCDLEQILGKVALDVKSKGCVAVFIDYLQLIETSGRGTKRVEELSRITRRLKQFAVRHGTPVITASQLNRLTETENRPPRLSDLRESGSIEQDADRVILIHKASKEGGGSVVHKADIFQAKNRNGPTCGIEAKFNPITTTFHENR